MKRKATDAYSKFPVAVLRNRTLSTGARLLYALLMSYAWQEGMCFPDEQTLAADLGTSDRTVRRYCDELVAAGLVTVKQRGQGRSNLYAFPASDEEPSDRTPVSTQDRTPVSTLNDDRTSVSDLDRTDTSDPLEEDEDSLTKKDTTAHAVARPPSRKQPQPRAKAASPTATAPSATRLLAEAWMKANDVDGALAGGETHKKYNQWAQLQLKKRDRETVTCFLRWAYSKRRHEGAQYDIVPHIVDERIGQWIAMGRPERYVPRTQQGSSGAGYMPAPLSDPDAPPRWIKPDPRIIDRDVDRNNDRFIRYWGNPPFLMTDEERDAAGVTAW